MTTTLQHTCMARVCMRGAGGARRRRPQEVGGRMYMYRYTEYTCMREEVTRMRRMTLICKEVTSTCVARVYACDARRVARGERMYMHAHMQRGDEHATRVCMRREEGRAAQKNACVGEDVCILVVRTLHTLSDPRHTPASGPVCLPPRPRTGEGSGRRIRGPSAIGLLTTSVSARMAAREEVSTCTEHARKIARAGQHATRAATRRWRTCKCEARGQRGEKMSRRAAHVRPRSMCMHAEHVYARRAAR